MEHPLRFASAGRSPAQRAFTQRRAGRRRGAKWSASDRNLARNSWVNLFVVGAEDEVAKLLASLWPCLATPIVVRHRGEPLRLPRTFPVGTLVIYEVETLTRKEQDALHQWLCTGSGHARVVSSAAQALFPMVEAGVFDDALYYHLNIITIDLTSPPQGT
jgi:sigma-54-interacting transcriptional regulator